MQFDGFDWDDGNREKCRLHGVSIPEIEEALSVVRFVVDDPSPVEKRYRTVGRTRAGRHVFAVFTMRGALLRPISVRYMHGKEVRTYEEALACAEERRGS
ncbi:MAG: BrnT family toxin [Geminicoccaceae bacterium]|nr:BrnT family toxin [Geminicoccaceae bacterium]MCB9968768.1 BrnT family toxin [Geminicoccaceae bacterium]HRY26559.1 BrnT family toxin [Geminicoccaceae bacterium]